MPSIAPTLSDAEQGWPTGKRDLRHMAVRDLALCAVRRASSLVVQNNLIIHVGSKVVFGRM